MLNLFTSHRKRFHTYQFSFHTYNQGVFLIALLISGCGSGPTSANTPEKMFTEVLQKPIPDSITQLQGVGDTWQGYQVFLRFQAAKADIQSILQSGYKSVDCDAISSDFRLPDPSYDRFDPPWQPQAISSNQCWTANSVSNPWTGSGTHHVLIDQQAKWIYFAGLGI
ncbi:hypothetical protein [Acaryochloris sp. IP29b_bin.137]|uniref:hypothetical protein n=1 Tax=Acaryochloris sp. IP29b_bin.137 TaxID=2969217 RepID=UPI0026350B57|nr:hypothetical protein [Acaryochloris sp. IP29b_bin.137]